MFALGATSVDELHWRTSLVVHAGTVTLTMPNPPGCAMTSFISWYALNWITCRFACVMAWFSVELKSCDSCVRPACAVGPKGAAAGDLPASGRLKTITYCAPAAFNFPTAVARSTAACETLACSCACVIWPVANAVNCLNRSLPPPSI